MKAYPEAGIVLLVLTPNYFTLVTSESTGFSWLVYLYLTKTGRTVHNPYQAVRKTQLIDTRSHSHPSAAILNSY
jgi:hypothetical protein